MSAKRVAAFAWGGAGAQGGAEHGVPPDGCAGQSSRDWKLCKAQPQVNLIVRLRR
jgi:hypothetical protein